MEITFRDQTAGGVVSAAGTDSHRSIPQMETEMSPQSVRRLSSDEILRIARLDAEKAYRDLTPYHIRILLAEAGSEWTVEYEMKDSNSQGGGASYRIDSISGKILFKEYSQ